MRGAACEMRDRATVALKVGPLPRSGPTPQRFGLLSRLLPDREAKRPRGRIRFAGSP